jgi:hypothetical protein
LDWTLDIKKKKKTLISEGGFIASQRNPLFFPPILGNEGRQ